MQVTSKLLRELHGSTDPEFIAMARAVIGSQKIFVPADSVESGKLFRYEVEPTVAALAFSNMAGYYTDRWRNEALEMVDLVGFDDVFQLPVKYNPISGKPMVPGDVFYDLTEDELWEIAYTNLKGAYTVGAKESRILAEYLENTPEVHRALTALREDERSRKRSKVWDRATDIINGEMVQEDSRPSTAATGGGGWNEVALYFNEVEIKAIAWDMRINWDDVPGETKVNRMMELSGICRRRGGRDAELWNRMKAARPNMPDRLRAVVVW